MSDFHSSNVHAPLIASRNKNDDDCDEYYSCVDSPDENIEIITEYFRPDWGYYTDKICDSNHLNQ